MPSPADGAPPKGFRQDSRQSSQPESWQDFWFSIVRIVVLQVAILLALSGAFVVYLNWSSEVSFAEFLAAGSVWAPSNPSLQSVSRHSPCDQGGV